MKTMWPAPQQQPQGPIFGEPTPFTFDDYHRARHRQTPPAHRTRREWLATRRLFRTFGAYRVKPKRGSLGMIWRNRPFYWSSKGYYRPGFTTGPRRPLQHYIWEFHHRRKMPAMHEIFFKDRDRHNFAIGNMDMISKAELHKRTLELGETRRLTFEERSKIRGRWATGHSRELTGLLLSNFNQKEKHEHHDQTSFIISRRERLQTMRKVRPR